MKMHLIFRESSYTLIKAYRVNVLQLYILREKTIKVYILIELNCTFHLKVFRYL